MKPPPVHEIPDAVRSAACMHDAPELRLMPFAHTAAPSAEIDSSLNARPLPTPSPMGFGRSGMRISTAE
eukprot:4476647-Prymnesium_polylepis.1